MTVLYSISNMLLAAMANVWRDADIEILDIEYLLRDTA
jgi:hypothetical protein